MQTRTVRDVTFKYRVDTVDLRRHGLEECRVIDFATGVDAHRVARHVQVHHVLDLIDGSILHFLADHEIGPQQSLFFTHEHDELHGTLRLQVVFLERARDVQHGKRSNAVVDGAGR